MLPRMERLARVLDALLAPGVPLALAAHASFAQLALHACAFLADTDAGGQQLDRWWPGLAASVGFEHLYLEGLPATPLAVAAVVAAGAFCGLGLARRPCGLPGAMLGAALVATPWIAPILRLSALADPQYLAPLVVVPAWLGAEVGTATLAHLPYAQAKKLALRAFERRYLSAVLQRCNGNISSAARAAGVDRSNFRRLLKQYDVERDGAAVNDEAEAEAVA